MRSRRANRRIVVHVLDWGDHRGTAQAHIVEGLARTLDPSHYELKAWFLNGTGVALNALVEAGVEAQAVPFRSGRDIPGTLRMSASLLATRPALVHIHGGGRSRLWLLHALSSAKVVGHVHGVYSEDGRPHRLEPLVRTADAVIATSNAVAASVRAPTVVVYPGIDVPPNPPTKDLGLVPTIGTVARLEPIKGLEHMLHAVARLRERYPSIQAEVAGAGSCESSLRRLANKLGVAESVRFLGWQTNVPEVHRRWDVFVQPSVYEGFGVAALEAMASGLPLVASDAGGLRELVVNGRTGFLVPVGDVAALTYRLDVLLRDPELRFALGAEGRRRAAARFTVSQMAERIRALYDRLLT